MLNYNQTELKQKTTTFSYNNQYLLAKGFGVLVNKTQNIIVKSGNYN